MSRKRLAVALLCCVFGCVAVSHVSAQGVSSGEVTVQLAQGLDSAANPNGKSQGRITKTTNPAIPVGTGVLVGVMPDPGSGGFTVQLLGIAIGGQPTPAASSGVVAAPDIFNRMQEKTRAPGQPQDAVSGARVFLPQRMTVRFTLTEVPAAPARPAVAAEPRVAEARPAAPVPPAAPAGPVTGKAGDFPAGPGLPVLHTERTPWEGCRWVPVVSRRYGFALLVMDCPAKGPEAHTHTAEDPDFVNSYEDVKRQNAANPKQSHGATITVFSKPAEQPLDAAVRAQVLTTVKLRWRPYCHVKRSEGEGQSKSGVEMYTFTGTSGPALRVYEKADLGDDLPCSPWEDNDSANDFVYKPAESKTTFFYVSLGQDEQDFDIDSIRFLPAAN